MVTSNNQSYKLEPKVLFQIEQPGALLRVHGPEPSENLSVVQQLLHHLERLKYNICFVNFERDFTSKELEELDVFLYRLCAIVSSKLDIIDTLEHRWSKRRNSKRNCTDYFEKHIFYELRQPFVLAMNEVEAISQDVSNDFFGLIRSWFSKAKLNPHSPWARCRWILAHTAEPHRLITDLLQSPFNVGHCINPS